MANWQQIDKLTEIFGLGWLHGTQILVKGLLTKPDSVRLPLCVQFVQADGASTVWWHWGICVTSTVEPLAIICPEQGRDE